MDEHITNEGAVSENAAPELYSETEESSLGQAAVAEEAADAKIENDEPEIEVPGADEQNEPEDIPGDSAVSAEQNEPEASPEDDACSEEPAEGGIAAESESASEADAANKSDEAADDTDAGEHTDDLSSDEESSEKSTESAADSTDDDSAVSCEEAEDTVPDVPSETPPDEPPVPSEAAPETAVAAETDTETNAAADGADKSDASASAGQESPAAPVAVQKPRRQLSAKAKKNILIITVSVLAVICLLGLYALGQVLQLKAGASALKTDVKQVAACFAAGDAGGAEAAAAQLKADTDDVERRLRSPLVRLASTLPNIGDDIRSATTVIQTLGAATDELIQPAAEMMENYPLSELREGTSVRCDVLYAYVSLLLEREDTINTCLQVVSEYEPGIADPNGSLAEYIRLAGEVREPVAAAYEKLLPQLAEFLESHIENSGSELQIVADAGELLEFVIKNSSGLRGLIASAGSIDLGSIDAEGKLSGYLELGSSALDIVDKYADSILVPLASMLKEHPYTGLSVNGGINTGFISAAMDFYTGHSDAVKALLEELQLFTAEHYPDISEKTSDYLPLLDRVEEIIPVAQAILGDGGDRTYLIVAQNAAEIRNSGGFPGSAGLIEIKDGVLTFGSFSSIRDWVEFYAPESANITWEERNIFCYDMYQSWDACYCPDFERFSYIISCAYEAKFGSRVDGIISCTPVVIQKLLGVFGEITLSEGTVLNGENATKFLQLDIYAKYLSDYSPTFMGDAYVDGLFAEAAEKTLEYITGLSLDSGTISALLDIYEEMRDDRTLEVWLDDEEAEQIIRDCGLSGGLSTNKDEPVTGIYFSNQYASKIGWYLDVEVKIGDYFVNSDGSRTYNMKVTFTNNYKSEYNAIYSSYINGVDGIMLIRAQLVAPAGGYVGKVYSNCGIVIYNNNYNGHNISFFSTLLKCSSSFTLTYTVTTAPGVDADLGLSLTPTLTEYRLAAGE